MNKADPLMAMMRQLSGGKAASRTASQSAMAAKDHKGKLEAGKGSAAQFREQLRAIAQGAKQEPQQPHVEKAEPEQTQDAEPLHSLAEAVDQVASRPRERDRTRQHAAESRSDRVSGEAAPSAAPEWRVPDATLNSMMSRLDQTFSSQDDVDAPRAAPSQTRAEHRATLPEPGEPAKSSKTEVVPEQRFSSSFGAIETRSMPVVKVAVRDQETHFQPVGQPTLLQKIVDRIAPDLATAPAQPAASSADAAPPDMRRGPDAPIRMLTLQLDPPSMGTVTVRMRLAGDAVEVRLSAERPETTQLLRQERGALMDAMQSAGYSFDIASIDHSHASQLPPAAGQSHTQSDQQQFQQPQSGSQFNDGASERQSNDAQAGARHSRQGHDQFTKPTERHQDDEVALNRTGGALYL
jgi:chemotaxis protein MotD